MASSRVAVGVGEEAHGHEPPVAALVHRRHGRRARRRSRGARLALSRSPTSTSISLSPTCRSAVARATRSPCASASCSAPCVRAGVPCSGRPAASHMSASTTVLLSSSTRLPAACRLATACVNVSSALGHVPLRPGGEPEEPGRTAPREMVVGAGQVEGAPGVFRRARRIASGLGERGPVDGDGRRQRPELLGVGPRGSLPVRYGGQRAFRVVESGLRPPRGRRRPSAWYP